MINRQHAARREHRNVTLKTGDLLRVWPDIRIAAKDDRAEFTLSKVGLGYVPVSFQNLTSQKDYVVTIDGERLDRIVHGKDYWRTDYDVKTERWSQTYNIPIDDEKQEARTIVLSKQSPEELTTPTGGDFSDELGAVQALGELKNAPAIFTDDTTPGIAATIAAAGERKRIYFNALDYKGKPTRVFAVIGMPSGTSKEKPVPGVVLIHGGGGTAFPEWVKKWNDRGYAAISLAVEGQADTRGNSKARKKKHAMAGPARVGTYGDTRVRPVSDQWMYHAVADTVLANSLLRSLPEVDADNVGVMGISWGGVIAATVMGIDPRFTFAIPTYGCGHLYDAGNHYGAALGTNTFYREVWDPMVRIAEATMPALWYSWPGEPHFPLSTQARNYYAAPGSRMVCLVPGLRHGHQAAWNRQECYDFADGIVKHGGIPWCRQESISRLENGSNNSATAKVTFTSSRSLHAASLIYTTGTHVITRDISTNLIWEETPLAAPVKGPADTWVVLASLPQGVTGWYINVKAKAAAARQDIDVIASSDYQESTAVSVGPAGGLTIAHPIEATTSTGKVDISFIAPSGVEITDMRISDESHANGAFSLVKKLPLVVITFDNAIAQLTDGQHATATLCVVWKGGGQWDGGTTDQQVQLPISATAVNTLITNGSFENPVLKSGFAQYSSENQMNAPTNWDISAGGVTHIKDGTFGGTSSQDAGKQWLSLQNNQSKPAGVISQTFPTTPGATYTLEFTYAALALRRVWNLYFDVGGGSPVQTVSLDTSALLQTTWSSWHSKTLDFVAKDTQTTLTFKGEQISGFHGMAIDRVEVRAKWR